jgi:hypothetical protein
MQNQNIFVKHVNFLNRFIVIPIILLCSLSVGMSRDTAVDRSDSRPPMPTLSLKGMSEYQQHVSVAGRYIEEGDFDSALESLHLAKLKFDKDPLLYEMFGIAYDANRESEIAFKYYVEAFTRYLELGNRDKSFDMLGWMHTIPEYREQEDLLRARFLETDTASKN